MLHPNTTTTTTTTTNNNNNNNNNTVANRILIPVFFAPIHQIH
jgi:hypothetical protein